MAHYVLSDIHGESARFYNLLEEICFSEDDTLYILGDVIDRGPHGISLLRDIMRRPNVHMLLGNHEYMCLQYHSPQATEVEIARWNRNGNATTLAELAALSEDEREEVFEFMRNLPLHMDITVEGQAYHLVHGFPGETTRDQVWERPTPNTPNPFPDGRKVIVGHTPVLSLLYPREEHGIILEEMEEAGDHLCIFHGEGFTDIDCGCGHSIFVKRLACLRLEDGAEFYE